MYHFLLACLLLGLSYPIYAQKPNPKVDSLERALKTAKDTSKVNIYMELVRAYGQKNPDKALEYAKIAQKEAVLIQFTRGEADALTAISVFYKKKGNINEAFRLQNEALSLFEKINEKKGIGNSLNNIGSLYLEKTNYPLALEYYQKALKIREEINDEKGILGCWNNIGLIYNLQANENSQNKLLHEKALSYYTKGLALAKKLKNEASEASLLNNIGAIYDEQKNFAEALKYYKMALTIYEHTQNKFYLVSSHHHIGSLYRKQKDFEKAKEHERKSLQIATEVKDKIGMAKAQYGLANAYNAQGLYAQALQEALPTIEVFKQVGARDDLLKAKKLVSDIYASLGDFSKAYQLYQEASALKDSIFNIANTKQMAGLQESFAIAQKEKEIQVQAEKQKAKDARQNLFNYLGLGILVFILGITFLLYRGQQRQKRYNKEIASEKNKSDSLLLNILPSEVADELKDKGSATARHYQKASVLFTDFQGFTKRTAGMTPQEVIAELNQCFSTFDAIIEKYNLEKIKTIGDAYMCAGGLPTPNDTNPIDAVRAGLEMQAYMEQYRAECEAKGEPYFRCRLGINTGEVVAGVVGTKKFAYDIWGDTVNTASRAESGGEVGMVNITQSTYEDVKDYFECEYRGEIEVKGKGQIKMYFVLREKKA